MEWWLFLFHLLLIFSIRVNAISRRDFPPGFIFGAGSSAYQVEGAAAEDGRKPSIWDTFAHAGKNHDHSNGDKAADQYHKYKEDVKLMHEMGLDAYRFSISWSRVIPEGRGSVNPKGLQYYNILIDELLSHGIEPHVTLYHFDLPQTLEDEYAGLLSSKIVKDFTQYADVCFKEFGDRVKHWATFNEPFVDAYFGHDVGILPPGHCSYPFGLHCSKGNSTVEPYITAHNILLSHASAVKLYRKKYQAKQGGHIGITILGNWYEPATDSQEDVAAAQRMMDFEIGWYMSPLVYGTYPAIMKTIVGSRLPFLDGKTSKELKGSFDFIGINHYSVRYVQADPRQWDHNQRDYSRDVAVRLTVPNGVLGKNPSGLKSTITPIVPWALQRMLEYVKVQYKNPPVLIHENGYEDDNTNTGEDDNNRKEYLRSYIGNLLVSIRNGSNTRGYFVWSFIDLFEFIFGYTHHYGLYGVDFKDKDRKRYPRLSAQWYSDFLKNSSKKRECFLCTQVNCSINTF